MIEGTWTLEGHSVSYEQSGDTVVIRETITHPTREPHNSHTSTSLEKAKEHQERYIRLGYDKIS
jgi:hypothetical protein